jgi:hypothetical protein
VVQPGAEHVQGQLVWGRIVSGHRNLLRVPSQPGKTNEIKSN